MRNCIYFPLLIISKSPYLNSEKIVVIKVCCGERFDKSCGCTREQCKECFSGDSA